MVGNHVHHHAHTVRVGSVRQALEGEAPAEALGYLRMIDDVIAVHRTGGRLKNRGAVDVRDAQFLKVRQYIHRVTKGEIRSQLETVRRNGLAALR